MSALAGCYLLSLENGLDDHAAAREAGGDDPDGCTRPEWNALALDVRARPVGFEIARCAVVMLDRMASFEKDIHDVAPETWEVGSSNGMEGDLR